MVTQIEAGGCRSPELIEKKLQELLHFATFSYVLQDSVLFFRISLNRN